MKTFNKFSEQLFEASVSGNLDKQWTSRNGREVVTIKDFTKAIGGKQTVHFTKRGQKGDFKMDHKVFLQRYKL